MSTRLLRSTDLDRRIKFQRKAIDNSLTSAGKEPWEDVAIVWASVQDVLPSRGERLSDGLQIANRPARVRVSYRAGITADMRIVLLRRENGNYVAERVLQIISGPAELGRRDGLELLAEDYSTAGGVT